MCVRASSGAAYTARRATAMGSSASSLGSGAGSEAIASMNEPDSSVVRAACSANVVRRAGTSSSFTRSSRKCT